MKKRFWALLLAVMMVVSVLPTAAFAEDPTEPTVEDTPQTANDKGVNISKSVTDNNNDTYKVTLESWVEGTTETIPGAVDPMDIVLVLDVSGSMEGPITITTPTKEDFKPVSGRPPRTFLVFSIPTNTNEYVLIDWKYSEGEYWYSEDGETFYPVTNIQRVEREEGDFLSKKTYVKYVYTYNKGDDVSGDYTTNEEANYILQENPVDKESPNNIYYKTVTGGVQTMSKLAALQSATKNFIDKMSSANESQPDGKKHQIALVKFAGEEKRDTGNHVDNRGYNYTQIVKEFGTSDSDLKAAVDALEYGGATSADYAMNRTEVALTDAKGARQESKKVIIFFTDGEPNHDRGFDKSVAQAAVNKAKSLKNAGAEVYTIGVFSNNENKQVDKFMTDMATDAKHYQKVTETDSEKAGSLNKIFEGIATSITKPSVSVDGSAILTDTVSKYFTPVIPEDENVEAVTVEVWSAGGNEETATWTKDVSASDITVSVENKKISVTGFDYSANALAQQQDGSWTGKKLVISFDITPDTSCDDWKQGTEYYPTNVAGDDEDNAGLYSESGEAFASLDRSPTVPVTAYSVTYSYNKPTPADAPKVPDTKAYLPGTKVFVAPAPTLPGYSFSGWTTKANVGISENKFTMPECAVDLTGSWSENPPATTYSVTYNWTGLPDGKEVYTGTGAEKVKVTLPVDTKEYADDASYTIDTTYTSDTVAYTTDDNGNVKDRYIFSGWDKTDGTISEADVIVSGTWDLDNWNDEDDKLTGGDGIPDKYQAKVTYQVVNGTWSNDATADQVKIFTLYQKNLTDNTWQPITPAVTLGNTIPTGMKPAGGYTDEGAWNEKITAETPVTKDATYTYTFTAKVPEPGLSVTKTVNKTSVTVGDTVKYTITVKNTGNVKLTDVFVAENFSGDFSKIFDIAGAIQSENGFEIDRLDVGEYRNITFSYKTTKRETLKNSVVVSALNPANPDGGTVTGSAKSPDVTVKSEPITPVGPSKPQLNYEDHYAYVVGYPDGLVHPERNITRAEVATIFFRMLLDESREYFWAQENDFSDVAETDWFNNAVSTLANAQLINGYPDGSYRPNANITRAEFATIAIRFFLDEDVEIEENNLSDVKGHWAEANINLAYALELINGYPDGTFRPDQKITRAEAMAIVNRVLKRAPEKDHLLKDMIEWPDNLNTAAWYYADVQEATNSHKFHMDKEEEYEIWTELLPVRDWVALEQEWSKANSSKNPGEVVDIKITTPEAGDNGLKLD